MKFYNKAPQMALPILCTLLITASAAIGEEKAAPQQNELTLKQACTEAGNGSLEVLAAKLRADAALRRQQQAKSRYWPKLTLEQRCLRTDDPAISSTLLSQQNRDFRTDRPGISDYQMKAEVNYLVYDFGEREAEAKAALHEKIAAEKNASAIRSRILASTVDSFFEAMYAEEQIKTLAAEKERMEKRLALAKLLLQGGRGLKSDVLASEYHLERVKREELVAGYIRDNALERLAYLMGRPAKAVTEKLVEGKDSPINPAFEIASPEQAELQGVKDSPELASLAERVLAREATLRGRRASLFPRINAMGSIQQNDNDFLGYEEHQNSYTVGLTVSWNVFDGGLRKARIKEARSLVESVRATRNDREKQIMLQIRRRWRNLQEAARGKEVSRKRADYHRARFEEREQAYKLGRESFHELLEEQTDLSNAELQEIFARFRVKREAASLLDSTGFWASWNGIESIFHDDIEAPVDTQTEAAMTPEEAVDRLISVKPVNNSKPMLPASFSSKKVAAQTTPQPDSGKAWEEWLAKAQKIADNRKEPAIIFDRISGRIYAVNDAAIKLYGYSRTEFLKQNMNEIGARRLNGDRKAVLRAKDGITIERPLEVKDICKPKKKSTGSRRRPQLIRKEETASRNLNPELDVFCGY